MSIIDDICDSINIVINIIAGHWSLSYDIMSRDSGCCNTATIIFIYHYEDTMNYETMTLQELSILEKKLEQESNIYSSQEQAIKLLLN